MKNTMNPTIELRSFKSYAKLSEETLAFTAVLWIDGKRIGEVGNRGNGGANTYPYQAPEIRELEAEMKNLPKSVTKYGELAISMDWMLSWLAGEMDAAVAENRQMKGKIWVRLAGRTYGPGSWTVFKVARSAEVLASIEAKYGKIVEEREPKKIGPIPFLEIVALMGAEAPV